MMLRVLAPLTLVFALAATAPATGQDFWRSLLGIRPPPAAVPKAAPPQQTPAPARVRPEPEPEPAPKVEAAPPAYDGEMTRLAEILGALHFLRPLCGAAEGSRWRREMVSLIEIEDPPAERRDRLIASFNRTYLAYEQSYRTCTPSAEVAIRRFLDEGARLAHEIATTYGN